VLFCDLVDSTLLATQLDPEDYRTVVRAFQEGVAAVVQRFEGHIAQHLGDGLLVYFGWPQAHEDDARRAVHTGLGILEAMVPLQSQLERTYGIRLAVRLGIHTGLVVVGAMGSGGRQEQLALGEVPNIAVRLQGLAAPDAVLISEATYRLVQGTFTLDALGLQALKGVGAPLQVYRVVGENPVQSRPDGVDAGSVTPLVGRASEVALLLERWQQSVDGQGQVVLLGGEAGIGKSRLVQVLREHAAQMGSPRIACRCSAYHTSSALYPVIKHVERLLQFHRHDTPDAKLGTLERTLTRPQVEELVRHVAGGKALPAAVVQQIVARTDGIPLYVEEVTRLVLESGSLEEQAGQYVLSGPVATVTIPPTLQGALLARLDRLGAAREVAQLGSVIGRQFTYNLLQAVSSLGEATLQQYLGQLVAADILTPRGMPPQATYTFTHALIQEAAYQSLLRSSRQHCHEQLAQALTAQFPDIAATQPELLAHHYTEAGLHEHAVPAWQRAGERAVARSAYAEASGHFTTGLEILQGLPETPARHRQELGLQTALGLAQIAMEGYGSPNVERTYRTAWFHLLRREATAAREAAEASAALSQDQGFAQVLALATQCRGAALALQGQLDEGMAQMQQGLEAFRATGAEMHLTWYLSNLAWTYGQAGQVEAGWSVLAEALTFANEREEHFVRAWLYCIQGTLLLQRHPLDAQQAEACFQQALDVARRQQAKSWELRAAMSLARLWQRQGKPGEAHRLLAETYGWFTEGLIPPIYRRRRHCWRSWRQITYDVSSEHTLFSSYYLLLSLCATLC
jgi:class 3 adenylate cyclase/tetratricopeptide (TPR) repeat protein